MATLRELKGRIGSVASSEKITGAMKMISSAKMHKAEGALRRLLPYRRQLETIIGNLMSADAPVESPLTVEKPVEKVAIVVLGSDDGLCGAYNVNLQKFLQEHIGKLRAEHGEEVGIEIYTVGKKMHKAALKLESGTVRVLNDASINSKSDGETVRQFNLSLQEQFLKGEVQQVEAVYMNFRSISRQVPTVSRMLPVSATMFDDTKAVATGRPYLFEPDARTIYATVLPMFLMSMMQEIFCENRASEQAARVMAMQSANDNAKKLLEQLRLEYNKLRQQSITSELLDIVGGQVK